MKHWNYGGILKMKAIYTIIIVILLSGCYAFDQEDENTGRCYVVTARYLMGKPAVLTAEDFEKYPYKGSVYWVFDAENDDPNLELSTLYPVNQEEVWEYQDNGWKVAIQYPIGEESHVRPLEHHEVLPGNTQVGYVCGNFDMLYKEE